MFKHQSSGLLARVVKKFTPGPPRHLNEARFATIDRKQCTFVWKSSGLIEINLQDRAMSLTFPLLVSRDAGKFLSCIENGGIATLTGPKDSSTELRIGSDKGVVYFALKGGETSITTGLAPAETAIATSLIRSAYNTRLARSM